MRRNYSSITWRQRRLICTTIAMYLLRHLILADLIYLMPQSNSGRLVADVSICFVLKQTNGLNPCCYEFILGKMKAYLYFRSFLRYMKSYIYTFGHDQFDNICHLYMKTFASTDVASHLFRYVVSQLIMRLRNFTRSKSHNRQRIGTPFLCTLLIVSVRV